MIRRRLLLAATVIASVVLAACSDMTAPKNDCPVTNGSNTCLVRTNDQRRSGCLVDSLRGSHRRLA